MENGLLAFDHIYPYRKLTLPDLMRDAAGEAALPALDSGEVMHDHVCYRQ